MRVGDVLSALGDLPGALKSYRDGLEIVEKLAKQDTGQCGLAAYLFRSYLGIGDAQRARAIWPGRSSVTATAWELSRT